MDDKQLTRPRIETIFPKILQHVLELHDAGAKIEIDAVVGADEVTAPGDAFINSKPNNTWTYTIKVNGGATDRNLATHLERLGLKPIER